MTKLLWKDIDDRCTKFQNEVKQRIKIREVMRDNYNAIRMFFLFLDEGILSGDAQLASSLWSTMYENNSCNYALHLDLVLYLQEFIILNFSGYIF